MHKPNDIVGKFGAGGSDITLSQLIQFRRCSTGRSLEQLLHQKEDEALFTYNKESLFSHMNYTLSIIIKNDFKTNDWYNTD